MHKTRETLVDWLNDAYGMEHNLIEVLERHIKDSESFPEAQARFRSHLAETHRQAERLKRCIEQFGGKVSAGKGMIGKMTGFFSGMTNRLADDTLVKDFLADISMEHFEIACYKSLISAAEALGEMDVVEVCRQNLQEEEAMASWLESHLNEVTQDYLAHAGH